MATIATPQATGERSTQPVAIVTGASSGIGLATALVLSEAGYKVYGLARRRDVLTERSSLSSPPVGVENQAFIPVQLDITDDAALVALIARIASTDQRIDVLINNAGYSLWGAIEDTSPADARAQLDVNLFAPVRLAQLVLPHMRAAGYGRIVNISSVAGEAPTPLAGWYTASKHALEGLTDVLRMEARPFGVGVVLVQPGPTRSDDHARGVGYIKRVSGEGAWKEWAWRTAEGMGKGLDKSDEADTSRDQPRAVAEVVFGAIREKDPGARYAVGWLGWGFIKFRRWVPQTWYDYVALKSFGCEGSQLLDKERKQGS